MTSEQNHVSDQQEKSTWINELSLAVSGENSVHLGKDYCKLKCRMIQRRLTLIYPYDLGEQSPEVLQYLSAFAQQNKLKLLRERRSDNIEPLYECRKQEPPILALGVGMLLQQTGLVGSDQLHLADTTPQPQVSGQRFGRLLKIGAEVSQKGKKVNLRPNRFIFGENAPQRRLDGYASKIIKGDESRIFSYFDADKFRALGYTSQSNFVFHVFAGGGEEQNTSIWGPLQVMTREPLHFRLFRSTSSERKFGMLYSSYTLNLSETAEDASYWKNKEMPTRQLTG